MDLISVPDIPNVSLVAFYGTKPPQLESLIRSLQQRISAAFQEQFEPYPLNQIHATLIGCEGLNTERGILNKWFLEKKGTYRYIDLQGFLTYIRQSRRFPIVVQIGGYKPTKDYGFISRNQHPFQRSFQFQGLIAILMGWPLKNGQFPLELDRLRLESQNFNLLHKFHDRPEPVDNDLYMRIGLLNKRPPDEEICKLEQEIREFLAKSPIDVSIDLDNIIFAQYQDLCLSLETTEIVSLGEATQTQLEKLYPKESNGVKQLQNSSQ